VVWPTRRGSSLFPSMLGEAADFNSVGGAGHDP
jgi:hypothetical protein